MLPRLYCITIMEFTELLEGMGEDVRAVTIDTELSLKMFTSLYTSNPKVRKLLSVDNVPVYMLYKVMNDLKQKTATSLVYKLEQTEDKSDPMFLRMCKLAFEFFLFDKKDIDASHLLKLAPSLLNEQFFESKEPTMATYVRRNEGVARSGLEYLLLKFGNKIETAINAGQNPFEHLEHLQKGVSYEFKEAWCMMNIIQASLRTKSYITTKLRKTICEFFDHYGYETSYDFIMLDMFFVYDLLTRRKGFDEISANSSILRTRARRTHRPDIPVIKRMQTVFLNADDCPKKIPKLLKKSLSNVVQNMNTTTRITFYDVLCSYAVQMLALTLNIKQRYIRECFQREGIYHEKTSYDFHIEFYTMILETLEKHNLVTSISHPVYTNEHGFIYNNTSYEQIREQYMNTKACYKLLSGVNRDLILNLHRDGYETIIPAYLKQKVIQQKFNVFQKDQDLVTSLVKHRIGAVRISRSL